MNDAKAADLDDTSARNLAERAERALGLTGALWELRQAAEGPRLVLRLAAPAEQHFRVVNQIAETLPEDDPFRDRISIVKRPAKDLTLDAAEVVLLSRTLSSTLTADRHAATDEFRTRYIASQSGAEQQVTATSNNIVFGRRGAGKSTLLVYAMHHFSDQGMACVWLDMQTYEKRDDAIVLLDILEEIAAELNSAVPASMDGFLNEAQKLREGPEPSLAAIRRAIPQFKRGALLTAKQSSGICIFLDDLHVLPSKRQPELLSLLYAFSRGNQIWLKVSALEHFTNHWDPSRRLGLDTPGDTQVVHLDYNLTNPQAALLHTTRIMDAIANQCGLPGIGSILNRGVLERLVWVAAGVPRDALDILRQSIATAAQPRRSSAKEGAVRPRKRVAVEDVNLAASRCIESKLHFLSLDGSLDSQTLSLLLEEVKQFCIKEQKRNAFLIPMHHDHEHYQQILKLIDLRFLHILNQGITKSRTGEKYVAVLLDYGFYTGARKAKTVDVLQKTPGRLTYEVLRKLPVFALK